MAFYAGRLGLICEFDEFNLDTPLNRVLQAALTAVTASPFLGTSVRASARGLLWRMDEVRSLRADDMRVQTDRRSAHYADGLVLARHILESTGRALTQGVEPVWTFLIHTPPVVEAGLRNVLADGTFGHVMCGKLPLVGSTLTVNPDLVWERGTHVLAVGDVKYKRTTAEWRRADLYQVVAFGTAYRVGHAAVCDFALDSGAGPPAVTIGDLTVRHFSWDASNEVAAEASAAGLLSQVEVWGQTLPAADQSSPAA